MLSSEALFAALFGALMLGERISFQGMIGCALIFFAMITVELVPALRSRGRPRSGLENQGRTTADQCETGDVLPGE
jgi:hypothetical protein